MQAAVVAAAVVVGTLVITAGARQARVRATTAESARAVGVVHGHYSQAMREAKAATGTPHYFIKRRDRIWQSER